MFKPPKNGKCECGTKVVQRSDDTTERITSRLNEFREKALPAIMYLQKKGIPLVSVPGHLEHFAEENVRKSVLSKLQKLFNE